MFHICVAFVEARRTEISPRVSRPSLPHRQRQPRRPHQAGLFLEVLACQRVVGAPPELLQRTTMYNRLINSPFSVVGHDDLQAYRGIQAGLHASGNPWISPAPQLRSERSGTEGRDRDRHQRDLDAQPVPRVGALHDDDDVMEGNAMPIDEAAAGRAPGRSQAGPRPVGGPTDATIGRRADITERELIDFVVREARLLDEEALRRMERALHRRCLLLGTASCRSGDGLNHTSHLYEDKLLRELRIERLRSPRAFSQQPPTRSHHLLQTPTVERSDPAANAYVLRSEFHYTESQGDELNTFVGTCFHHLTVDGGTLRMTLKRVDLINCDAALPAVQLFI